jgi:hypothetical protein
VTRLENAERLHLTPEKAEEVRFELDKILKSPAFQTSRRCHDFLEFIVSHTLQGDVDGLSERFLGADLFGRPIDYDTKADAIVRVRANDVRRRLGEYYSEHPSAPVVISLGTGSYIPEFQWTAQEAPVANHPSLAVTLSAKPLSESGDLHEPPAREASPDRQRAQPGVSRRLVTAGSIVAGVIILALAAGCLSLWQELRSLHDAMYPWQTSPAVAELWGRFLSDQRDTDLVLADASFGLVQALANKSYSLSDYLSRDYMNQLQDPDPRMAAALARISNWGLASPSEFEVAQRILALDPARQKIRLYSARKYMPDLIARDNVIVMGSRFGNPWAELFEGRMNFVFNSQNPNEIINRTPAKGEPPAYDYTPSGAFGYCIVAYLPTPDRNGSALLIQGSSGEPTQAGGDFLLTEARMADFKKLIGVSKLPYFELLLKTSWVKGTPINSTIVSYRTYGGPN